MMEKLFSLLLSLVFLLQLFSVISPVAEAARYTTANWNALIQNYKRELCGDDGVDRSDTEIRNNVSVSDANDLTISGISYKAGCCLLWKLEC